MRSYSVKANQLGSVVTEILRYRQTQILLLLYKDLFLISNFRVRFASYGIIISIKYFQLIAAISCYFHNFSCNVLAG